MTMDQVFRSKHILFPAQLFAAIFAIFLMVGCVISPRRTLGGGGGGGTPTPTPTATPTPNPAATGKLYVSNSGGASILRFDNAFTANGDATPAATITGANTTLSSPSFMTLDAAADRLYVANTGDLSVVIFDGVSTKTGTVNIAPTRTIAGVATGLLQPTDVALDKGRDMLYVADDIDIFVFNSASAAATNGNVAFARDISPGFAVSAIFIDATSNRLFVADQAADAIAIFDNASTLNGPVAATRVIQGAATHLAVPSGVQVDGTGRLIVSNVGNGTTIPPTITIFANAATADGNIAPVAEITGSATGMVTPDQIVVDKTGTGTLYNADPGAARIAAFAGLNTAHGNISATRSINGPSTGMTVGTQPVGVALDTTR
jgi:6-phosphogluconolactonase (cycloisomerase 2 family)